MNLDEIYTPLSEAKKELDKRWGDKELVRKVEEFLGIDIPIFFREEPRAILFRAVLTPNFEVDYFLDLADLIKLKPVCAEISIDKFCTMNKDKVHLGKMVFLHKKNINNFNNRTKKIVIDFDESEKKQFKDIKTINNKNFLDFHHHLFTKKHKNMMDIFDVSIFKKNGESIRDVYEKILSLSVFGGILFENLIVKDKEHEKVFIENVLLPAFDSVHKRFGIKPLIVPLLPLKNEEQEAWIWYSGTLEKEVESFLFNNN